MAGDFDDAGVFMKTRSGRSLKLELHLPYTVFTNTTYISIKDVEDVLAGRKKIGFIYILKPKERNLSCEKPELKG